MELQRSCLNITKGKTIAGTGTIDHKGNVGRIGGIEMKVMAAQIRQALRFFLFLMILLDADIAQNIPSRALIINPFLSKSRDK